MASPDTGPTQYADPETISYAFPSATHAAGKPPPPPSPSDSALLSWDTSCTPTAPLPALHTAPSKKGDLGCWVEVGSKEGKDGKDEDEDDKNEPSESSAAWGKIHDPRLRWTVVLMWVLIGLQVVCGMWEFGKGAWGWERWVPVVGRVGWWDGEIARAG